MKLMKAYKLLVWCVVAVVPLPLTLSALCRSTLSPRMLMELNLERSTWQLLYALYLDRVETEGQEDEMITDLLVCLERH